MTSRGTNSILILALRILPQIRFSFSNFIIPFIGAFTAAYLFFPSSDLGVSSLDKIITVCLSFDGAILGLILAVFAIYGSVEPNVRTLFSITNVPPEGKFSFYKVKLVTVFKMCFWVFFCSSVLLLSYTLLIFPGKISAANIIAEEYRIPVLAALVGWSQIKILIELKIYVFSMYQRSVNEARQLAIEKGLKPADSGID